MNARLQQRMIAGAHAYAAADRSDPFAFSRALSHINNGIAGVRTNENGDKVDAFYNAKPVVQTRKLPAGQMFSNGANTYQVTTYDAMVRP
jgi:hypothetical protein